MRDGQRDLDRSERPLVKSSLVLRLRRATLAAALVILTLAPALAKVRSSPSPSASAEFVRPAIDKTCDRAFDARDATWIIDACSDAATYYEERIVDGTYKGVDLIIGHFLAGACWVQVWEFSIGTPLIHKSKDWANAHFIYVLTHADPDSDTYKAAVGEMKLLNGEK